MQYAELLQQMKQVYSTARVCRYRPPDRRGLLRGLEEEDELENNLQEVVDYDLEAEINRTCLPTQNLEPGRKNRYSFGT